MCSLITFFSGLLYTFPVVGKEVCMVKEILVVIEEFLYIGDGWFLALELFTPIDEFIKLLQNLISETSTSIWLGIIEYFFDEFTTIRSDMITHTIIEIIEYNESLHNTLNFKLGLITLLGSLLDTSPEVGEEVGMIEEATIFIEEFFDIGNGRCRLSELPTPVNKGVILFTELFLKTLSGILSGILKDFFNEVTTSWHDLVLEAISETSE
jgi:hypothetical protein